jgi:hypothetical protein
MVIGMAAWHSEKRATGNWNETRWHCVDGLRTPSFT